ncbi:ABC transporter ATP-binding protein [Brevibacillus laterosporus]|uniref:ABC transporter ATP-binding protein n=1 Tax=Brevibacillus laterosporus TaxID=1465 RepID=A0AAP3DJ28_BRELA|nr:ABC transporter ATP-binding protein [Brevibacillus laterosporus]MCR8982239.1 ABC transporter ATP-binding protein [Brevibacillus laterosporus]MCZ0809394.1 ABC transporter ATP-binding protein [Brevibacillus laterosporus]MCZ0827769.1 ABC transporter ATP-binding protein [Brevibacillus laterosporus]MCZ0851718.1 ABC transporter ATP-binding protein [Brevibacillus laterosporus]MED1665569.1 ABC transporter ATP-binding protein [Brevibacillus laterosporus]
MALLELKEVHTYYGGIHALKGLSITVEQGEVVTLIGSNGAGKSTTLKTICGQVHTKEGQVFFDGQPITGKRPHDISALGIAHVPEGRRIFPKLTVRENLEMGAFSIKDQKVIEEGIERAFHYFPRLKERASQKGGTMSGGEQQMLAIARGLMMKPKILMLDEPSMGLAPILVEQIFEIVTELNQEGMTILLVEQNANQALAVAHRGYVIQTGEIILKDDAKNLLSDPQVREAYLA